MKRFPKLKLYERLISSGKWEFDVSHTELGYLNQAHMTRWVMVNHELNLFSVRHGALEKSNLPAGSTKHKQTQFHTLYKLHLKQYVLK